MVFNILASKYQRFIAIIRTVGPTKIESSKADLATTSIPRSCYKSIVSSWNSSIARHQASNTTWYFRFSFWTIGTLAKIPSAR